MTTQYANDYGILNSITLINQLETKRIDYILEENVKQSDLHNKEVEITLNNGDVISGIVREVASKGIVLARNGNWGDRELINIKEINNIEASEYPYHSFSHKRNLREQKKPRFEFRFNKEELNSLTGKYVSINYDGKVIEGQVIGCKFSKNGSNEIVLKTMSNETKSIHDYRLRSIEITGSSYSEHKGLKRLRDLEEELFMISEDKYTCDCSDGPENKIIEPDYLLEKYFEAKIRLLEGDYIDLGNFNYNWIQEIIGQKEKYSDKNGADKKFYKDIKKARDLNNYYNLRKSFIDLTFNKIKGIDWSQYSKNQTKGEIEALEYIYESGVITK